METGTRFADVAWHRRAGKDDVGLHWAACALHLRVGTYWHMLPEASQARKAIWEAVDPHTSKRRIDVAFPKELREVTRENEMMIRFRIGSTWQVVGSDNFDSLVGSPPVGIVFSEWALSRPESWNYLRPILLENGGWALFIWTPRGRNHAVRTFEARQRDSNWFTERLPATRTGVFSPEQLANERAAYIAECGSEEEGDALFRQEYLVDFDAPVPGSYFGEALSKAQDENRIGSCSYNPLLKVKTAWDIGVDDYTAIWFFQDDGKRVFVIDYYETSGEGAPAIVAHLKSKEWAGNYGTHFLPHDVMVREWGAGARSRRDTLNGLGLRDIRVGIAADPADRINAARQLLPICHFDVSCHVGLDHLRNYRRRWNASQRVYSGPLHDENSHAADAFGEFAVNCQIRPAIQRPKPADPADLQRWRPQGGKSWRVA